MMTLEQAIESVVLLHDIFGRDGETVTERHILSGSRRPVVCEARASVMRLLNDNGWSARRIGLYMHRQPSTVLHAIKKPSNP